METVKTAIAETAGTAVTLPQLLAARDSRASRQKELLQRGGALVCLTVNMPGPVKRCALADALFDAGLHAVGEAIGGCFLFYETRRRSTGCEAFWLVDMAPRALKALLCGLEESHPLGRLWDIDVLGPDGIPLNRQSVGFSPRQCLLCQNAAVLCARSRAHPLPELLEQMQSMLRAWESAQ